MAEEKLYCIVTGGTFPGNSTMHRVENMRPCPPTVKMDGNDKAMWLEIIPELEDIEKHLEKLKANGQAGDIVRLYPRSKSFRIMFDVLVGTKAALTKFYADRLAQTFETVDSIPHNEEYEEENQQRLRETVAKAKDEKHPGIYRNNVAQMGLMSVIHPVAQAYDEYRKTFDDPPKREVAVIQLEPDEKTDANE